MFLSSASSSSHRYTVKGAFTLTSGLRSFSAHAQRNKQITSFVNQRNMSSSSSNRSSTTPHTYAYPHPAAPPSAVPPNWKYLAPAPPPGTSTFQHQSSLPRLPVLPLAETLQKLRCSLKASAWNEEEAKEALRKVDEFGKAGGVGELLQGRLEERAREPGREHWLEEWWDKGAYLAYRDSVMVNVSYYYGFTPHPAHYPRTPAHRAAALTRAALLFRRDLKRGELPPDMTKEGPLCMDTWRWMFDCCRVPAPGMDYAVSYAKEGESGEGHVVVFRKGRVWKMEVGGKEGILSTQELERQFQYIYDHTKEAYPGVGVLTSNDRDTWAKDYAVLVQDEQNQAVLEAIHSAAFAVSLDEERPEGMVDFSRALWHGGVEGGMLGNRWFDKPANFVVFDNMQAGVVGEHSVMDGTPMARMCDEMVEALHSPEFDHGVPSSSSSSSSSSSLVLPTPLDWVITPSLTMALTRATESGKALLSSQAMSYHLTSYGKALIKSFQFSPDSYTQLVIQLAYARLLGGEGKPGGTYEAATTRKFLKGRTETIRVVTEESEKWVRAMREEGVSGEERRRLARDAGKVHGVMAREAGNARGIDRHLLGLRMLVKEGEEVPGLWSDPVYVRASRWTLSTSAVWSKHFPSYGWGEVVPDGFGVAYMTGHDDRLQFTVTSRKEMPNARFIEEIARAAQDMRALFEEELQAKKSKL